MLRSLVKIGIAVFFLVVGVGMQSRVAANTCMQDCDAWYSGCATACEEAGFPAGCTDICDETGDYCNEHSEWCNPGSGSWCAHYSCWLSFANGNVEFVNCTCSAYRQ